MPFGRKQINWYFGIPAAVAAISSVFGVRALFSGLLSSRVKSNISAMMIISVAMVLLLCVVEYIIWLWLRNPAIVIS